MATWTTSAACIAFAMWGGSTGNLLPKTIAGYSTGAPVTSVGSAVIAATEVLVPRNMSTSVSPTSDSFAPCMSGSYMSIPVLWTSGARGYIPTRMPALKNASRSEPANQRGSASISWIMETSGVFPRSVWITSNCRWSVMRGCIFASSSARAKSALEARSIAFAALSWRNPLSNSTWASRSFDRLRNSVWYRPSILPNRTSPAIPNAIIASAIAVPHCSRNESYSGWMPAMINSATTPTITNPANPHSQVSQDSDARSNCASVAFVVPSGRRHSGKAFRGFWWGVGGGTLIFGLLFLMSLL